MTYFSVEVGIGQLSYHSFCRCVRSMTPAAKLQIEYELDYNNSFPINVHQEHLNTVLCQGPILEVGLLFLT